MKKNSIKNLRDKYKADIKKQDIFRNKQMLKNEKIMKEQFKQFETKDINIVNEKDTKYPVGSYEPLVNEVIEPNNELLEKVILKDSLTLFF